MTTETNTKNVYQRIHAVMNDIETIAKNGKNSFHNYNYATEADYVHALRPLLQKHGLVIIPELVSAPQLVDTVTSLAMKFTIVNIDKPEEKVFSVIPAQGQDKGDKGVYKALTGAKKYFAALTFMVATGDDPERDEKKSVAVSPKAPAITQGGTTGVPVASVSGVVTNGTDTTRRPSFRKPTVTVGGPVAQSTTNGASEDI